MTTPGELLGEQLCAALRANNTVAVIRDTIAPIELTSVATLPIGDITVVLNGGSWTKPVSVFYSVTADAADGSISKCPEINLTTPAFVGYSCAIESDRQRDWAVSVHFEVGESNMAMSPATSYTKSMYSKFKRYAAWPPGQQIKLGDIGVIRDNVFEMKKNLSDLGFTYKVRKGEPTDWEHKSGKKVSVSVKAAGDSFEFPPVPLKQASARIEFGGAGAFVFQAAECVESQIENTDALGKKIIQWIKTNDWQPEWVVVDAVITTARAVVMVSDSDKAEVDLSASGNLGTGGVSLAKASGGLNVTREVGSVTKVIGKKKGLTPMFAVSRVRKTIWDYVTGGEGNISRAAKKGVKKKAAPKKKTAATAKIDPAKALERVKPK